MKIDEFDPLNDEPYQVMDNEGNVLIEGWKQVLPDDELVKALENMMFVRQFDAMAISYQRQGRIYTYPPHFGQEAPAIAGGSVLRENDWVVPSNRELGAWYMRGVTPKELFLFYRGHEDGQYFEHAPRVLPVSVPIADQIPHAAGVGYAMKYRGEDAVVLTYSGDGGTSEGDFHEGLNFAAVWQAPLVLVVQNNHYAISVPIHKQTHSKTLAAKALAYGMPGIRVDGNDYLAMYEVLALATEHARSGGGPVLIEAVTYRRGAHTTSDDPKKYRTAEEEKEWEPRDPITRLRAYLVQKGLWSTDDEEGLLERYKAEIDAQLREAENHPPQSLDDVFGYTFSELTTELERQKSEYQDFLATKEHQ